MSTDEVADAEVDRRYNHWKQNDVDRCKYGHFVSKPEPENGQVRYYCEACERYLLEWTGE